MDLTKKVMDRYTSIQFTNPISGPSSKPKQPEKPKPFHEQMKEKSQKRKELMDLDKKRKELMEGLQGKKAVDDPNDDPQYLFKQIRPTLSKMNIATISDASKIEIDEQTDSKGRRLYRVPLRREAVLVDDQIERIKRNVGEFEKIEWTSKGIIVSVWGEYVPVGQPANVPAAPVRSNELSDSCKYSNIKPVGECPVELSKVSSELDLIASDLEPHRPDVSLFLDRMADAIDKMASKPSVDQLLKIVGPDHSLSVNDLKKIGPGDIEMADKILRGEIKPGDVQAAGKPALGIVLALLLAAAGIGKADAAEAQKIIKMPEMSIKGNPDSKVQQQLVKNFPMLFAQKA